MAPKRRQTALKQNLQFASPVQMKRPNQAHGIASFNEEEEEEMERNFALFNKRGPEQKSQLNEKEPSGEESNEATEDEENNSSEDSVKEYRQAESTDMTGSEESHDQRDCRRNNPRSHAETEVQGGEVSADATLL